MSVDLNDPDIARIRRELLDPASATSWMLLHYNPSSTTPALSVVASGQKPVIEQWKEHLVRLQEHGDAVVFGYGEFQGKGCVLLQLDDSVAGVKRARAVVHSRAVAQLFPDYSALITISKSDELTDSLINERLGLDFYQQRSLPVRTSSSSRQILDEPAQPPPIQKEVLPAVPAAMVHSDTLPPPTTANPIPPSQPTSTAIAPTPRHVSPPRPAVPSSRQVSNASPMTPMRHPQESESFLQNRQASGNGPEPLPDVTADRQRKVSLTARLGKAFGNPAMQSRPSEYTSDGSPTSASSSSRIKSSFSKAFRRTSGGTSPQHSPRADTHDGPPVPPKDGYPARSAAQATDSSGSGAYRTPSGGMGYAPPIVYVAPKEAGSSTAAGSFPEAVSGLYPARNSTENHLSPSPSAKRIMTEARIKSVEQEEEIQNRFRRDLNLDDKNPEAREEVDDLDDDIRLPYDTSDHSVTDHLPTDGADDVPAKQDAAPLNMQIPRKPVDYGLTDPENHDANPVSSSNARDSDGAGLPHEVLDSSKISEKAQVDTAMVPLGPPLPKLDEDLSNRLRDEQRQHETENIQVDHQEAESADQQRQADELARQVEIQRMKEQEEQKRLEAEALQRAAAAAELQRHAEEYALQKEAERLREQEEHHRQQEEQERQEAEARRIQEELERQRRDEEEEKLRIALEEQHRMDQIRLAEEEARRRTEEANRIAAEKEEAERVRKEGITQALRDEKQRGGVMLRGHVTVQTMKNPTWRRRVFRLLPSEMQLFKNEADEKPIQTIHLSHGVSIEHTYEESQVQGSWKIVSGQEAFFIFADSPEEKETILEGLNIALS